ncbi:PTS system, trehalose-specific IIB component [Streptococcus sp. ZB199]|nr:PTS system, trehalose-specific IIB component [Streptococcus sp. ZB199]
MGKFEQEAKDLLQAIGGKENVTAVTHCATRMRFVLGDEKKANIKAIESIPAVKGTFTNAGQFQVIIGNDVPIFTMISQPCLGLKESQKKQPSLQPRAIKMPFNGL